ncbi:hypothetical protein B0H13DRAFT_1921097 [Mycena leptocephala]|nr:hypothetical protein B0H13DRAFT_1921097 [Mycena leptocephala]
MLQGLFSAEKSVLIELGYSIITLDTFSTLMLKGSCTLFQQLPHLIEVTGNSGLRWTYIIKCINNQELWHVIENVEAVIEEGVQHFATGTHTPAEAVGFYRAAARYYTHRSVEKATEFTKLALLFAHQADDIRLQLLSMETEYTIAYTWSLPYWGLEVAHKAWKIARFVSNYWQYHCTYWEAWGTCQIGNLSRALNLCKHAEELLISDGMEGSDRYLNILDLRFDIHFVQTNYIEAHHILTQIVDKTAPTCSPWFHAYSLSMIAYIDILTGCEVPKIVKSLNHAKAVYAALGSQSRPICSWVAAELQLYCGDIKNACSSFIACVSSGLGLHKHIQYCLETLGNPKHRMHGTIDTFRWAMVYFAFERKTKQLPGTLTALRCLADIYTVLGDEETALNLFHMALEGATKLDIHHLRAECMTGIGDIMMRRGNPVQAEEMWTQCSPTICLFIANEDAALIEERIKKPALTRGVESVTIALDSDTDTCQSSLAQLQILSAPKDSLPEVQSSIVLPRLGYGWLRAELTKAGLHRLAHGLANGSTQNCKSPLLRGVRLGY